MRQDLSTKENNVILCLGLTYSRQVAINHHSRPLLYPLPERGVICRDLEELLLIAKLKYWAESVGI